MRTLKKTLSLVLVVAMVLGLCVVGASAKNAVDDFTDADKIGDAYYEAVGVMTGIGVIKGMGDGILSPTGNYTRAQAAKIITYMLIGEKAAESLVCTTAPFEDVAANHWAAGYIAFCVEQGIINGMSATTFEPEGQLTGFQWAKMLLCAVGFGSQGEFTGNSWSLNTAKVAHSVGVFTGDLAGADHVALQRQQAILYAFNVLTTVPQVTYAPGITGYIEGVVNYKPVTDLGQTLGWSIYKLASVTGIIVDNEGMGASATYVDSVVAADGDVKVVADTGLDMMYHAARVWYIVGTKANNGVYVYDLAKVESTTCPGKLPTTFKTIGDKTGKAYQLDVVDNSAIDAGKTNVVTYAVFGNMGYVDKAAKTTTVIAPSYGTNRTVPTTSVKTDVSAISYMDPIVYIYTESVKEDGVGLYIYAATATSGVIKTVTKDNSGNIVSLTLTDGTVLKISSLFIDNSNNNEEYVLGHVYAFVLDTHGDVIYATKDNVRDLWVFTGDWKFDNEYNGWSSERVVSGNFANVTTGEIKAFAIRSFKSDYYANIGVDDFSDYDAVRLRGTYYDLSATTTESGIYVATQVTAAETASSAYAAKFVIGDTNFVRSGNYWVDDWDYNNMGMYFDPDAVVFKIGTGYGSTFEVKTCTGVAALKETFNVSANGMLQLDNAAFTVTITESGDYRVDTVFVMIEDVESTSNYAFVPSDISYNNWSTVTGDQGKYFVTYKGAYLEGEAIDIVFHEKLLSGDKIVRGFYTVVKFYDAYGKEYMMLEQKVDNAANELCFYGQPTMRSTGSNGVWEFYGPDARWWTADGTTKIVDFTSHEIASLSELYTYITTHKVNVAYTVDPNTNKVDYIYVVSAGWDALYTVALSDKLTAAGWSIVGDTQLADEDAYAAETAGKWTVTLKNSNLTGKTTDYGFNANVSKDGGKTYGADIMSTDLTNGTITVTFAVDQFDQDSVKTYNYTIGGLDNDSAITLAVTPAEAAYYEIVSPLSYAAGEYVFGTPVKVTVEIKFASDGNDLRMLFDNEFTNYADLDVVTATVDTHGDVKYQNVSFTTTLLANGAYTLMSGNWE